MTEMCMESRGMQDMELKNFFTADEMGDDKPAMTEEEANAIF